MDQSLLKKIATIRKEHPNNLMAKHFKDDYYKSLSPEMAKRLEAIVKSGCDNPDSSMGCYAMHPDDYDLFKPYLDAVIRDYHKIPGEVHHVTDWNLESVKDKLPAGGKLDLTILGLGATSMRVRVGRNLANYPLPGSLNKDKRIALENDMIKVFEKLIADPAYGGTYHSLTQNNKYTIDDKKYQQLVDDHIMFKDMSADPYLKSAGIALDWPHGRGCYVSADKGFIVWVGEEDHLRIMCMEKGTVLNNVFDRLRKVCDVIETSGLKFAHSNDYGYVTSCPTNLGTGMRASVHIQVPKLTADGTDAKAKAICKPLGLSVRGMGGEHTPIGKDGTVDVSPSARLCVREADIICALYQGIELLLKEEAKL
jgi:creatine kinase